MVNSAGAIRRTYTYYPGIDAPHGVEENGSFSYFAQDPSGNVVGVLNSAGEIANRYKYAPFGTLESSSEAFANSVRYAGREYDAETQLYFNRARYYDPVLGRFISEDPIGLEGGINQYAYAGNDPVDFCDPSGMLRCSVRFMDSFKGHGVGNAAIGDPSGAPGIHIRVPGSSRVNVYDAHCFDDYTGRMGWGMASGDLGVDPGDAFMEAIARARLIADYNAMREEAQGVAAAAKVKGQSKLQPRHATFGECMSNGLNLVPDEVKNLALLGISLGAGGETARFIGSKLTLRGLRMGNQGVESIGLQLALDIGRVLPMTRWVGGVTTGAIALAAGGAALACWNNPEVFDR